MKKILASLAVIAVVASASVGATKAYFSDTETSSGNTFSAGTLDLTVGGKEGSQVVHITRTNLMPYPHFSHSYGDEFDLKNVGTVPGVLSMTIQNIQNGTTTCDSAKVAALAAASLPACVPNSTTGGQLGNLMFAVWSRNEAPWGALSSVYSPLNTIGGVQIFPSNAGFSGVLNPGQTIASYLDLEWDTHAGTLDNTAQGDTLSFDVVFTLDQSH